MWSLIGSTTCGKCESTDRRGDRYSTQISNLSIPATVLNDLGKVRTASLKFLLERALGTLSSMPAVKIVSWMVLSLCLKQSQLLETIKMK